MVNPPTLQGGGYAFNTQRFQSPVLKRKRNDSDEDAGYATTTISSSRKRAVHALRPKEQRDERQRKFYERLAAVNGVVTPSTLAPGEVPRPMNPQSEDCKYQCPICRGWHKRRDHVQSHFARCVEMYGNPNGARWDDTWNDPAYGTNRGSLSFSELQSNQLQAPRPEAYMLAGTQFDDSATGNFQFNGYQPNSIFSASYMLAGTQFDDSATGNFQFNGYQPNSIFSASYMLAGTQFDDSATGNFQLNGHQPHSIFSASKSSENQQPDLEYPDPSVMFNPLDSLEHYDPDFSHLQPRLRPCASDNSEPHDENLSMGSLTNGTLLSRFQHWQKAIHDGQAHLQQTMQELERRGMLDANGTWVVDPGRVDMALKRGQYGDLLRNGSML